MSILRGKIHRFQGQFEESLSCLPPVPIIGQTGNLLFDEDLDDLLCETGDALRELNEPLRAEQLLCTYLARKDLAASSA